MYEYRKMSEEERRAVVEQRRAMGWPPHSPPRMAEDGTMCLLTAACFEHRALMGSAARREQVLDALWAQFTEAGHQVVAWVVLPNHYHVLARLAAADGLGRLFRLVHGRLSRQWNLDDDAPGRQCWCSFTDRTIRSECHFFTTLNYIHYNPVKHGHAALPYDWMQSSVHWYRHAFGREWLRDLWCAYPVRRYGEGWDEERPR